MDKLETVVWKLLLDISRCLVTLSLLDMFMCSLVGFKILGELNIPDIVSSWVSTATKFNFHLKLKKINMVVWGKSNADIWVNFRYTRLVASPSLVNEVEWLWYLDLFGCCMHVL